MIKRVDIEAARIIGMANVQALERAGIVLVFRDEPKPTPTHAASEMPNDLRIILHRAAEIFDVPIRAIIEQNRVARIVEARQAVVAVARQRTSLSLMELGQHLGKRDHTTMIFAVAAAERRARKNIRYAERLAELQGVV